MAAVRETELREEIEEKDVIIGELEEKVDDLEWLIENKEKPRRGWVAILFFLATALGFIAGYFAK